MPDNSPEEPGGHSSGAHGLEPPAENCPCGQAVHHPIAVVLLLPDAPKPGGHDTCGEHGTEPPGEKNPSVQFVHPSVALTAPSLLEGPIPGGQVICAQALNPPAE